MRTRGSAGATQRQAAAGTDRAHSPTPAADASAERVDAAIATVLAAEQAARASIAAAADTAQSITADARGAARRIAARAAQRSARIHDALQQRLQSGLATIEAQRLALQTAPPPLDEPHVIAVAQALARRLTIEGSQ